MAVAERGLTTRRVRATGPGRGKYVRTRTLTPTIWRTLVEPTRSYPPPLGSDLFPSGSRMKRRPGDRRTCYLLLNTSHLLRLPFLVQNAVVVQYAYVSLTNG